MHPRTLGHIDDEGQFGVVVHEEALTVDLTKLSFFWPSGQAIRMLGAGDLGPGSGSCNPI